MKKIYLMFVCLICICTLCACSNKQETIDIEPTVVIKSEQSENSVNECENSPIENPQESELIEEALVEQGYFNDLIPLDYDLQAELRAACDEFGVPFPLMVAMIDKETGFENTIGDDGNAFGYLQIWYKWTWDKMEEIGTTDLMNPVDNFRTGCYLISCNLQEHSVYNALSIYNTGSSGYSEYAERVCELYDYWEAVL